MLQELFSFSFFKQNKTKQLSPYWLFCKARMLVGAAAIEITLPDGNGAGRRPGGDS